MKDNTKRVITIGGIVLILSGTLGIPTQSLALEDTNMNKTDIVIRTGEYPNKSGKRLIVNNDFSIDCPLRYDEGNYCVQEWDMNYKVANAIVKYLEEQGVNVKLQATENKSEDLNRAGKIAKQSNPKIYLSIHHNSYKEDSEGYFFMVNENDSLSSKYAQDLSNAMSDNPMLIPRKENRRNVNGYIGEMNQRPGKVNILGELGFFSNPNEIKKCVSDEQVNFIAEKIGNELIKILSEIND